MFGKRNRFTGHCERAAVKEIYRNSATQHLTYISSYPPHRLHSNLLLRSIQNRHSSSTHPKTRTHTPTTPKRQPSVVSRPQRPAQFQLCCDRTQEACAALGGSIKSNGIFFYFRRRFRSGQRCFTQTFKTGPLEEGISKNKSLHSSGPHRET